MRTLSKSKILAYRQCPKKLWLEVKEPKDQIVEAATQARFDEGHAIGALAQTLYGLKNPKQIIDPHTEGFSAAYARTQELLQSSQAIFEAGFTAEGALAFADVMLPVKKAGKRAWRMVEVKSSSEAKPYHEDDMAVQAFVARKAGVPLTGIALAHIDSQWVYQGDQDYRGLLVENDFTEQAFARTKEVALWIEQAQAVLRKKSAPKVTTGSHCSSPHLCGFLAHCQAQEPQAEFPVGWLPRVQSKNLKAHLAQDDVIELAQVPDHLLNEIQLRVKTHTMSGRAYFDATGAAADLAGYKLPAYFLDFETVQFAVPRWKGARPYQQIPFQFSLHRLARNGKLSHQEFLEVSGQEPCQAFAEALVEACGKRGPVFVYNATFEKSRIKELAARFKKLNRALLAINERIVDLHPITANRYYHPAQEGSWSIKSVLPAVAPDLNYQQLEGVQDGGAAMIAYKEAVATDTMLARKNEIQQQLLAYCKLDTLAMVRLWKFLSGDSKSN